MFDAEGLACGNPAFDLEKFTIQQKSIQKFY